MPNGPKPKEDMEKTVAPFTAKTGVKVNVEVVGWDVQFDRIRNAAVSGEGPDITQAGTTQVPFFAALGGFEDLSDRVDDIGGKAAYAAGVWKTTQVAGPGRHVGRAVVHRGAADLLPQGRPRRRPASTRRRRSRTWTRSGDAAGDQGQGAEIGGKPIQPFGAPGKKAFDLVHHVMPFVWDNGGAELSDDAKKSTINSPEAAAGRRVHGRPDHGGPVRQEPARA